LVPVRALDCAGEGTVSYIIAALNWVVARPRPPLSPGPGFFCPTPCLFPPMRVAPPLPGEGCGRIWWAPHPLIRPSAHGSVPRSSGRLPSVRAARGDKPLARGQPILHAGCRRGGRRRDGLFCRRGGREQRPCRRLPPPRCREGRRGHPPQTAILYECATRPSWGG